MKPIYTGVEKYTSHSRGTSPSPGGTIRMPQYPDLGSSEPFLSGANRVAEVHRDDGPSPPPIYPGLRSAPGFMEKPALKPKPSAFGVFPGGMELQQLDSVPSSSMPQSPPRTRDQTTEAAENPRVVTTFPLPAAKTTSPKTRKGGSRTNLAGILKK
jgi:hypothetical protein